MLELQHSSLVHKVGSVDVCVRFVGLFCALSSVVTRRSIDVCASYKN